MKPIHKVTLANIKSNKNRTLITIAGTAIAVAMVAAIAVFAASFWGYAEDFAITQSGNWHIAFNGVNKQAAPLLKKDSAVKSTDIMRLEGITLLGQSEENEESLAIMAYSAGAFKRMPLALSEGRLPRKPGELVLSDTFRDTAGKNWQLGEQITLPLIAGTPDGSTTAETRTYTLVGYSNLFYQEKHHTDDIMFTGLTLLDETALAQDDFSLTVQILLQDPATAEKDGERLQNKLNTLYKGEASISSPYMNSTLLALAGSFSDEAGQAVRRTLLIFAAVLFTIIAIGAVSLIANAFSISLAERTRTLGMLGSIGATPAQKRSSVYFEACVIGIFSIPMGILLGIGLSSLLLQVLGKALQVMINIPIVPRIYVPLWTIIITVLGSCIILLLSCLLPAASAARISPLAAMQGNAKPEKLKRIRKKALVRRLFGFEAEIGLKNLKRNRKRYRSIMVSLVISVVLFLTVSSILRFMVQGSGLSQSENQYDLKLSTYSLKYNFDSLDEYLQYVDSVGEISYVDRADGYIDIRATAKIPADILQDLIPEGKPDKNGLVDVPITLRGLDENAMKTYCQHTGISPDIFKGGNPVIILTSPVNTLGYSDNKKFTSTPTKLVTGDTLPMQFMQENGNTLQQQFYVGAVTDKTIAPFTGLAFEKELPTIIVRLQDIESLVQMGGWDESWGFSINSGIAMISSNPGAAYTEISALNKQTGFMPYIDNITEERRTERTMMAMVSTFVYGFIGMISLVCAANIFNTISTAILLRTREFTMLRSVGLTPKGFNRMLDFESIMYGAKALLYGFPLSALLAYLIYNSTGGIPGYGFSLPVGSYLFAAAAIFLLIGSTMIYTRRKIRNLNIAETIQNENW